MPEPKKLNPSKVPPTLPLNPFIEEGSAEETQYTIDCVLAFVQEYGIGLQATFEHSMPCDTKHMSGLLRVLSGVRDAVEYLSYLDAVPTSNVTKLEVES